MTDQLNTRSQEFRDRLFALMREFNVEMQVEEDASGWETVPTGVNFFAYTQYDDNGDMVHNEVNVTLGCWEDGQGG